MYVLSGQIVRFRGIVKCIDQKSVQEHIFGAVLEESGSYRVHLLLDRPLREWGVKDDGMKTADDRYVRPFSCPCCRSA